MDFDTRLEAKIGEFGVAKAPDMIFHPFVLCWQFPVEPVDRPFSQAVFDMCEEEYLDRDVLHLGVPRFPLRYRNMRILDLFDPREVDYRLDLCDREQMAQIPDGSFDLVFCDSILEHLSRFWIGAEQIQRIMRSGAYVIAAVPTVWPFHTQMPIGGGEAGFCGGDYWRMTHLGIQQAFDQCEDVGTWYRTGSPKMGDDPRSGFGVMYVGRKR